jgi:hypothetical protein
VASCKKHISLRSPVFRKRGRTFTGATVAKRGTERGIHLRKRSGAVLIAVIALVSADGLSISRAQPELESASALPHAKPLNLPCGLDPNPNYPAPAAPPTVVVWTKSDLGELSDFPRCAMWQPSTSTDIVAVAGQFHDTRDADAMLAHIGAVSGLLDVRYWSVTDMQWNPLFTRVTALADATPSKPRADFSVAELRAGHDLYFLAADNRSGEETVWRLRMSELADGRIAVEMANVTPLRWFFVPFIRAGDIQIVYSLEHEPGETWRLYSLTRVLYVSPIFAGLVPQASYVNRALALYQHIVNPFSGRDLQAVPGHIQLPE